MEKEFSAKAMREISAQAKVTIMREKYSDIVNRINSAARGGEDNIVLENSKERPFCYELFDWLMELGFHLTYIHPGCNLKSDLWDGPGSTFDYVHAHWVRIAW